MELTCPECGQDEFSPQGLSGHVRFVHDLDVEEAREAVEQAKSGVATATSAEADGSPEQAETDAGDDIDRRLDELLRRREQSERARLISQLDAEDGGDGDRDPLGGLAEVVVAEAVKSGLYDSGPDEADVRAAVREELAATEAARADGAGAAPSDPVTAALDAGVDDPDTLREIGEIQGGSPWAETARYAVDRLADAELGEVVTNEAVSAAVGALTRPRDRQDPPADERPEPPGEPPRMPATDDAEADGWQPSSTRMRRERAEGGESHEEAGDGGGEN